MAVRPRRPTLWMALALLPAATAPAQQPEPLTECEEGNEPLSIAYGEHTSGCSISPAADVDTLEFEGSAGDVIRIIVKGNTNNLDPQVQILDPEGQSLEGGTCGAGTYDTCSFFVTRTLPLDGLYTLIVRDSGANNTGSYTLQLERVPPAEMPLTIKYNTTVTDTLSPPTDLDFLAFQGVADSLLTFTVTGTTNNLDPRLELIDPDGETAHTEYCGAGTYDTCSFSFDYILEKDGLYHLIVRDEGHNNTGGYHVNMQCLFGPCFCPDADGDELVGVQDLVTTIMHWGPCEGDPCPCDFDQDGDVDVGDLVLVIVNWGNCP